MYSSQMGQNEYSENEMGSSSLTEAPTGDTTEGALLKEAQMENPVDSFKEADEDIKESTSNQETELSSIKEETLIAEPQGTETSGATDTKEETHEFQVKIILSLLILTYLSHA